MKAGTCKHFNGIGLIGEGEKCCNAGVNYRQLVGGPDAGWACRIPCIKESSLRKPGQAPVACDKYEEPSQEEIAAHNEEMREAMARFEKTLPLITDMKRRCKGKSVVEERPCPVCETGTLVMSHASVNGHVHGRCSTENCVSWME